MSLRSRLDAMEQQAKELLVMISSVRKEVFGGPYTTRSILRRRGDEDEEEIEEAEEPEDVVAYIIVAPNPSSENGVDEYLQSLETEDGYEYEWVCNKKEATQFGSVKDAKEALKRQKVRSPKKVGMKGFRSIEIVPYYSPNSA